MALRWIFLTLLTPLLAAQEQDRPGTTISRARKETERCQQPQWDPKPHFVPKQKFYWLNEEVTLNCPLRVSFPLAVIRCAKEISPGWKNAWEVKDIQGAWHRVAENLTCPTGNCSKPQWDERLKFEKSRKNHKLHEEFKLTCPGDLEPSIPKVKCAWKFLKMDSGEPVYGETWWGTNSTGAWMYIETAVECVETCQRLQWDPRLQMLPEKESYKKNEEVTLSCPDGFQPSFTHVKCAGKVQITIHEQPFYIDLWSRKDSSGDWISIQSNVECIKTCQRPRWDSRLRLAPDQENYRKNEEVVLSCIEGFLPSFTHIKCSSEVQSISHGKPVNREVWRGRNSTSDWIRIRSNVECLELLQVVSESLEISSTSIKLNWTCRLPDACQHMRARCRLSAPSSPPCEAEEVEGEEMLHGQEGTLTCAPLQPFTEYSVTISLPPSMILFSWLVRTEETVPDKPEKLWLDPNTGSLSWEPLPSCKGEIIGYQLNITTRSAQDGSFLEMERLRLSSSVTEHPLPQHSPGNSYVVAIQGVTAVGAGAASLWEFQTNSPDTPHPLDTSCRSIHVISPSHGTAVIPLHPIARPPEATREHQLIVAVAHNGTALEGACLGEPQPFNASQQPATYVAAVLNLTGPMDFVLGTGTHGQGYHNAALQPGWDYMVLLRHVHHSPQAEKFTCVCYSFSVVAGLHPSPWRGTVIGMVVLLVVLLLSAGILWFVLSRKKKSLPSTAKEDN